MRAKTRKHRIAAALCAVPFLVLAGAGAASAAPAAAPAAAPSHAWSCNDWNRGSDCFDGGYGGYGNYGFDNYGFGYGNYGFAVVVFYG
ncbi:hypothetical protein DY245_16330 [Streptomyces inhibens]|uniref:Uncharacterized protein n=1 Tax=Streptomyces inhibens TaxID=2293571 RepID=A0A371Q3N8_STRIH|nr:hypothetical protein [Streptomyces inhibens]REK89334.1 hypothetical protein DY245_16330 [Streptomyces inhibens]